MHINPSNNLILYTNVTVTLYIKHVNVTNGYD